MNSMKKRNRIGLVLPIVLLGLLASCSEDFGPGESLQEIEAGAVVAGIVRDVNGNRAADAVITLEPLLGGRAASVAARIGFSDPEMAAKSARVLSTVADDEGFYAFDGLDEGSYVLTTRLRDHMGSSDRFELNAPTVQKADTTVVDITLTPTGTISGNATLENAALHSGTIVFVDGTSYVAVTDATGDFSLTGVPIGQRPVHATHPGYLDDTTTGTLTTAGDSTTVAALYLMLSSNMPPVIDTIESTITNLGDPTPFTATAHDPDGNVANYEWDFENDGTFDWSSAVDAAASHIYPASGEYLAKLRVTDDQGAYALSVVDVLVTDVPTGAIFVASTGDDLNNGGPFDPVQTIAQGLFLAQGAGMDSVLVAIGDYVGDVDLVDGVGIYGGRNPLTWAGGTGVHSQVTGSARTMRGTDISATTEIQWLHVTAGAGTAPGESSVALTLENCLPQLFFTSCVFEGGLGADGAAGSIGSNGNNGGNGSNGLQGYCDETYGRPGGNGGFGYYGYGGTGGSGGNQNNNGSNGGTGGNGSGPGGSGGTPGSTGSSGSNAGSATNGTAGNHGIGSALNDVPGTVINGVWTPGISGGGTNGTGGGSGGGGGGGGGQEGLLYVNGVGGSGGGGGGGGWPGIGGQGGQGGGASIGVLLINSDVGFVACTIVSAAGGSGGDGGNGGQGGNGGNRGNRGGRDCSDVGLGGYGGFGGDGGYGGGGAGGPGGPSYGIYAVGGTVDTGGVTFTVGTGGTGGQGGFGLNGGAPYVGAGGDDGVSLETNF